MESGICLRVGTGERISIVNDSWTPGTAHHLVELNMERNMVSKVADLIEANSRTWKERLIRDTFSSEVASHILKIPLAEIPHVDFVVWKGETSKEFSVRSAYKLL